MDRPSFDSILEKMQFVTQSSKILQKTNKIVSSLVEFLVSISKKYQTSILKLYFKILFQKDYFQVNKFVKMLN